MFGSLGGPEIILIFIVALIVFGPKQLPEIGRKVGGLVREFRRATGEFRVNLEREIGFDPVTGLEATKKARRDLLTSVTEPIREVTEGTITTVREARQEATAALTVARTPAPPKPAEPPPQPESAPPAGEVDPPSSPRDLPASRDPSANGSGKG